MRKIKRVRKARKVYGISKGESFLTLFYSYCIRAGKIEHGDHGKELSELRTAFNQYILEKYGRQFYDEYCRFHLLNKDNTTLIRALDRKKTVFLNNDILGLLSGKQTSDQEPEDKKRKQEEKTEKLRSFVVQITGEQPQGKEPEILPVVSSPIDLAPVQPVVQNKPYVDLTAGRIFSNLPARGIDYLPPSFSRRSFKITMKRLLDDSEFVVYHLGKDANEAMTIANRNNYDSARIIKVEEE